MPVNKRKTNQEHKDIPAKKKSCYYCDNNKEPSFFDSANLRRYMSDRSRINSKQRSGNCARHQRVLTEQIKYARHLALLPFITKVA
jgi:small subunit ribosomal protein S18